MSENKIDIARTRQVAKLARLALSEEELSQFSTQLSDILGYIEKLSEVDTESVEPLAHCLPVKNVFREDIVKPSLGTEKALANSPADDDEFFKVPKILDDGSGA
ncbi:MAG: Asp-tRNA(Asn)/Glu-tRNA(Gln) amidotransferase subunit GatC [Anaerohalosphaeraceae bacterium]|nr:Asp-tRNA(Asn)/Glu-tRNA(Gln) amidotransferase subunit GatC [Anaerohalosphaeraceae bacterium]